MARSNEAKALGIKAGLPYYQLKERFPNGEVTVFSSNYELYGDITDRVMSLVRKAAPTFYRYSIDEGFCDLSGMDNYDLKKYLRREFSYSNYEQNYTLPDDVVKDQISAKVEDGILTVTMPKAESKQKVSKAIEVS